VPTTVHVADVAHLVAAVAAVNNSSTPNTIIMAPGTYALPGELRIVNAGDLTIRQGVRKGTLSIAGDVQDRVFDIEGGKVTLSGLAISGGGNVQQGGGIYANNANLTVES